MGHGAAAKRRTGRRGKAAVTLPLMSHATRPTSLLDIAALVVGDEVHHPLLVLEVSAKGGDHPRTTLILGNRTGRIESAPFWSGRDEMVRDVKQGMLVQIVGKVTSYRESVQLEATSVRALPKGSVPLSELVPSVGSVEKYWQFIDEARERITAPRLRAVVDLFYRDENFRERYEQCPGAPGTGHHAVLGGLLQHTCEVLAIGRQIARVAHADEELVVAGCLLHDIGKLESYSWESGVFEMTERGRLVGHVAAGVIMLHQAIARVADSPCPPRELLLLEHFILSHHGKLEFGAAVKPLTLEAEILHFADDASAKTASINEAYALRENFPKDDGISAKKIWQLDGRFMFKAKLDFGRIAPE
jgi:3'-5' exoribonuclease